MEPSMTVATSKPISFIVMLKDGLFINHLRVPAAGSVSFATCLHKELSV
jgi:hypothetical protein